MSDFLSRLVESALGRRRLLEPRLPSRFEPSPASEPAGEPDGTELPKWTSSTRALGEAAPVRTTPARAPESKEAEIPRAAVPVPSEEWAGPARDSAGAPAIPAEPRRPPAPFHAKPDAFESTLPQPPRTPGEGASGAKGRTEAPVPAPSHEPRAGTPRERIAAISMAPSPSTSAESGAFGTDHSRAQASAPACRAGLEENAEDGGGVAPGAAATAEGEPPLLQPVSRPAGPAHPEWQPDSQLPGTRARSAERQPAPHRVVPRAAQRVGETPEPRPSPEVRVTIGRIEVKAIVPALPQRHPAEPKREPPLSLDDYLRRGRT